MKKVITKEISILVNKIRVVGILESTPESLTVQIRSPYQHLKADIHFASYPVGDGRFSTNGKLTKGGIEHGKDILKGLFFTGNYLQKHPEHTRRLRKYLARFEEKAKLIQEERQKLLNEFEDGKLPEKAHHSKLAELRFAEHQNVIGRGVIFRQYGEKLTQRSGGRADIQSILQFAS